MKKGLMLSTLLLGAMAAQAVDVAFDGQVRYRMENTNGTFNGDIDSYNHSKLRTRLGATVLPQDGLKIYIQVQDSRHIGDMVGTSGSTVEDSKLGLHQGYFTWQCQGLSGLEIKAGRFEMTKADHRFFGNADWDNVARSFEGWNLSYNVMNFTTVDFYGLKIMENEIAKRDVTNWGLYFNNILGRRLDFFYNVSDLGQNAAEDKNSFSTIGVHYDNTYYEKLGVNFNLGMQMGANEQGAADMDYAGMMYGLDVNYNLGLGILNTVGFGYESMSGDDPGSGDSFDAWIELYPTAHKFHGFQDIVNQPSAGLTGKGLNDIQVNFAGELPLGMAWKLDYHMFTSIEDYTNNAEAPATDVGSEIDLSLKKQMDNFGVNLGYSMFTPADNFSASGTDSQNWMYLQFTAGF